jgi:hypothetical protein
VRNLTAGCHSDRQKASLRILRLWHSRAILPARLPRPRRPKQLRASLSRPSRSGYSCQGRIRGETMRATGVLAAVAILWPLCMVTQAQTPATSSVTTSQSHSMQDIFSNAVAGPNLNSPSELEKANANASPSIKGNYSLGAQGNSTQSNFDPPYVPADSTNASNNSNSLDPSGGDGSQASSSSTLTTPGNPDQQTIRIFNGADPVPASNKPTPSGLPVRGDQALSKLFDDSNSSQTPISNSGNAPTLLDQPNGTDASASQAFGNGANAGDRMLQDMLSGSQGMPSSGNNSLQQLMGDQAAREKAEAQREAQALAAQQAAWLQAEQQRMQQQAAAQQEEAARRQADADEESADDAQSANFNSLMGTGIQGMGRNSAPSAGNYGLRPPSAPPQPSSSMRPCVPTRDNCGCTCAK